MFSRRHYEFLAKFIRREIELAELTPDPLNVNTREATIKSLARLLASELERDNPRFNRERFLKATGENR